MKLGDLSLLRNEGLSDEEVRKLKVVLAFHDRLPTEALQEQLLILMEEQPSMAPGEFECRVDQFAAQVRAAMAPLHISAYLAYAASAKVH